MYDTEAPPPSNNPLSPQIVSKRSHSSGSCRTVNESPPSSSPPTPAVTPTHSNARKDGEHQEGKGARQEGGIGDPEDRDASSTDAELPSPAPPPATDPSTAATPAPPIPTDDEEDRDPTSDASPAAAEADSEEYRRVLSSDNDDNNDGDLGKPLSIKPPPDTPRDAAEGGKGEMLSPDTPNFNQFLDFLGSGACGDGDGVSPEAVPSILPDVNDDDLVEGDLKSPPALDRQLSRNSRSGSRGDGEDGEAETDPAVDVMASATDFPGVPQHPPDDGSRHERPPLPPPPVESPWKHHPAYAYANRYSPDMADYVAAHDTKNKVGRRCYRLNLERPFDIHCEQSPLEYGDYMAPWTKEVFPDTVGPVEYCPPRHLGGEEVVWRELMRWSDNATTKEGEVEDERKVNSLDEQEYKKEALAGKQGSGDGSDGGSGGAGEEGEQGEFVLRSSLKIATGSQSPGGKVHVDAAETTGAEVEAADGNDNADASQNRVWDGTKKMSELVEDSVDPTKGYTPTGGWRCLTKAELRVVEDLGERNQYGELKFHTYDLSHIALNTNKEYAPTQNIMRGRGAGDDPSDLPPHPLRSVFSMDSTTSEDERLNPKSPEDMANETARLFRRSELSLKEAAEKERVAKMVREAEERRLEMERIQRKKDTGMLDDDDFLSGSQRIRRKAKKMSTGGKFIAKRLSKALSNMDAAGSSSNNIDVSWRGSSSYRQRSSRTSSGSDRNAGLTKRSSTQALTIDKARDLIDDSDDESADGLETSEDADKKPLNVSLYILGEYDILNDLCNDGGKRLRDSKELSDREVLIQNEPCPPPDRWVRCTGWGKCNPSSNYAKDPPSDFDWVHYFDKLRLKTGKKPHPQDPNNPSKDSAATESTADSSMHSTPARAGAGAPPPPGLSPIPDSPHYKASTDPSTRRNAGAAAAPANVTVTGKVVDPNDETTDFLSASARAPRTRRKKTSFTNDALSASERVPRHRRSDSGASTSSRQSSSGSVGSGYVPRGQGTPSAAPSGYVPRGQGAGTAAPSGYVPRGQGAGTAASSGYVPRGQGTGGYVPRGHGMGGSALGGGTASVLTSPGGGSVASVGTAGGMASPGAASPGVDMLSASERVPRTRGAMSRHSSAMNVTTRSPGAGGMASPGAASPGVDLLSASERVPRTRRGIGRRASMSNAAQPAGPDPLSASERVRKKAGIASRMKTLMRGKSGSNNQ